MSQFDALYRDLAAEPLIEFNGEPVTYWPRGENAGRVIEKAIVIRSPRSRIAESGNLAPHAEIKVYDDASRGIAASEIDTGGDEIEFSFEVGKAPTKHRITRRISISGGIVHLEVR